MKRKSKNIFLNVTFLVSVISFSLILFLVIGQIYEYFTNFEVKYKFVVDTEYEQTLKLDIDMIVATPCNLLSIMPMGVDDSSNSNPLQKLFGGDEKDEDLLHKNPSRFEMNEEETRLWTALQNVHKEQFKPGVALKLVNERTFLGNNIEEGLRFAADEKQRIELDELVRQRKKKKNNDDDEANVGDDHEHLLFLMGNGLGVFQIISIGDQRKDAEGSESPACRINGKIPVIKGSGDRLTISTGKSLNIGNFFTLFNSEPSQHGNISHRIERFHFGPHVWGLVTPLAGNEQIIDKSGIMFQYYIKVVPTKLYLTAASIFFNKPEVAYQYSVTYAKRNSKEGEHFHDSIIFDYEFADVIVEVWPISMYGPKILNGGFAGIIGVTCVFPIDLIKTRLQNQRVSLNGEVQYKGMFDCARQTWRNGGMSTFSKIRSLYAGSSVNILLITPEKAIKLVANDFFRHKLAVEGEENLSAMRGMIAGGLAGFCQVIITTPMELLKIQMQQSPMKEGTKRPTASSLALGLFREKGISGLYRGIGPTIARDVTFSIIYFPLFAQLNSLGPRKAGGSGDAIFYASFIAGILAGGIASFSVTPLDVIKTRIQVGRKSGHQYAGIRDAFIKILKQEGPNALFKGAACRMMVMAPLFGIAQTVYFIGVAEYFLGIKEGHHHV